MESLLALICIILGFVTAIFKVDILFPALTWFVAAIAFAHLSLPGVTVFQKKTE